MCSRNILSICISTYNRAERIEMLVTDILKCRSDRLSVVVVDDNSTDETQIRLAGISDERLQVFKNKTNLGARANWYETIDRGNGKFILHLLDRDWLDYRYLDRLIEILESTDAGFGYVSDLHNVSWSRSAADKTIAYYRKGEETIRTFAFNWAHPSGFLVKKSAWDFVKEKRIFTDIRYGTYPHAYVYALLAQNEAGIVIRYKMIPISDSANFVKNKSGFYKKANLDYYWMPQAWEKEMCAITGYCCKRKLWDKSLMQEILRIRFQDSLYHATMDYRKCAMSTETCMHYNVEKEYIAGSRLLKISVLFLLHYIRFLRIHRYHVLDIGFLAAIIKITVFNIKDILKLG